MHRRIGLSILGLVALVGASFSSLVPFAGPAGATDVGNETEFRTAFANTSETLISLTQDIHLTSPGCTAATRANGSALILEGNGHSIVQDCADVGILSAGTGGLTLNNVTLSGGDTAISANSSVSLNGSTISGLMATVGATGVSASGAVTVTDSQVVDVTTDGNFYGVSSASDVSLTRTTVARITAGGYLYASSNGGSYSATDSTFTDLTAGEYLYVNSNPGVTTHSGSTVARLTATGNGAYVYVTSNGSSASFTNSSVADVTAGPNGYVYVSSNTDDLTMNEVSIANVVVPGDDGYVYVGSSGGDVTLTGVTVDNVSAPSYVYGFSNSDAATMTNTRLSNLTAGEYVYGASNGGGTSLTNSSFIGFLASDETGYVYGISTGGPATLTNSTLADFQAPDYVYGISSPEMVTLVNSTITGLAGEAISTGSDVLLVYSDIVENGSSTAAGDFAQVDASNITLFGTVITNAVGDDFDNCLAESTTSAGYNFSDDTTCGLTGTGDHEGSGLDPLLGPLADNGGPTPTLLPQNASPLVDAIPTPACQSGPAAGITTDQRLLPRPQFGGCDIGSVELQPSPETPAVIEPTFTG